MNVKKLLLLIIQLSFLFLCGCSTTTDSIDNTNTINNLLPITPTNLTGAWNSQSICSLNWTDNSNNETGFRIERKIGAGSYIEIGTTNIDENYFYDYGLLLNTTYTYRVCSFNNTGNSPTYSNEFVLTTTSLPTLSTTPANLISTTSVKSGATIFGNGGSPITVSGVIWSTSPNPSISLSTKTIDGTVSGNFISSITGLIGNTTYYIRAYATNVGGTAYGNEESFTTNPIVTDYDGNTYETVSFGNCPEVKTWGIKNLNVSHYSDGTIIPQVTDPVQWANLTTGAWCYYNNDPANGAIYGKLYNGYAVAGIYNSASLNNPALRKKLAPVGYHIMSTSDYTCLLGQLGGSSVAGGKMKETGTSHWNPPNTGALNSINFSGLPGGFRYFTFGIPHNSLFSSIRNYAYFWISNAYSCSDNTFPSTLCGGCIILYYNNTVLSEDGVYLFNGMSVRFVKD
ncbi:FISUMP domain-containing protein [Flavobacterium sp.]|uniref:FISUMP domain-containing protein n=1 Tax=Flavobacterium sp. TaxID=239 RepID=UPI003340E181